MNWLKDKEWLITKSNYLVGFGFGMWLTSLFLKPLDGWGASLFWNVAGILTMLIGAALEKLSRKKAK